MSNKDVSNRTLFAIVMGVIALSLFSTVMSINHIHGLSGVTGYLSATGTGQVNLTVSANAFVNITDNFINFSDMQVAQNNWSEQLNHSGAEDGDFFEIANAGSVGINVSLYATGNDTGLFASSTTTGCDGSSENADDDATCIFVRCNSTTNSTGGGTTPHVAGAGMCATGFQQLGEVGSESYVFTNLSISGRVNVSVNVTVPGDEPSGVKTGSIIILGSEGFV